MVALTSLNRQPADFVDLDCHADSIRRIWRAVESQADDEASQMMAVDTLTYLPDDILMKVDRAAMSASLETRAPFLGPSDSGTCLAPADRGQGGGAGWQAGASGDSLEACAAGLGERPKQGFSIPLDDWLRGPLSDWAGDLLAPGAVRRVGLLEPTAVATLWERHRRGMEQAGTRLWPLLMLQAWSTCDEGCGQKFASAQRDGNYQTVPA